MKTTGLNNSFLLVEIVLVLLLVLDELSSRAGEAANLTGTLLLPLLLRSDLRFPEDEFFNFRI
jgi:hypothetical protein